jgi:hypothetical protein
MARSEQLVLITVVTWERDVGRVKNQVGPFAIEVDPDSLRRAVARMDEVARRWRALQRGGSLTFRWPRHLTFDASTSRRGRRSERRVRSGARP